LYLKRNFGALFLGSDSSPAGDAFITNPYQFVTKVFRAFFTPISIGAIVDVDAIVPRERESAFDRSNEPEAHP
jgi:hypothetical protein